MKEAFLHYVWRTRRFRRDGLRTTAGAEVDLLQFGQYNTGSGPDFSGARVRIDGTVWAGHVEMHLRSSDWHHHRHQFDPAYDNVVLHVVWEDDEPVLNARGVALPTLVLAPLVPGLVVDRYEELAADEHAIPCQRYLSETPQLVLDGWVERMTLQRLERKTEEAHRLLTAKRSDWDGAFFHQLGRCLGLPLNADAMDALLEALPLTVLQRYRADAVALEALLLGTAGLLEPHVEYFDEYPRQLVREYEHLARKHGITPLHPGMWNFRGLRPASFPTVRLVQLAAMLRSLPRVFDAFLEEGDPRAMLKLFDVEPHGYWRTHYVLDRASGPRRKTIGKSAGQTAIINAVVPFVFLYGRLQGRPECEARALSLLEQLPPERNAVIEQWAAIGLEPETAAESQALLTLRKEYCRPRRCLECAIGHALLKRGRREIGGGLRQNPSVSEPSPTAPTVAREPPLPSPRARSAPPPPRGSARGALRDRRRGPAPALPLGGPQAHGLLDPHDRRR